MHSDTALASRIQSDNLDDRLRQVKMKLFLDAFASHGNKRLACIAAGIHRNTLYHWLHNSSEEDCKPNYMVVYEEGTVPFAQAVAIAAEEAADVLEEEVRRRAIDGWEEPVFGTLGTPETVTDARGNEREVVRKYTGQVGSVRKFSDLLLMFLMKKVNPQFRENHKVDVTTTHVMDVTDSARNRLAEKVQAAIERRQQAQIGAGPSDAPGKSAGAGEPGGQVIDVVALTVPNSEAQNP
jgi:hypothetical protein